MIAPKQLLIGKVIKVDPTNRTLNVQVQGTDREIANVFIANNPGNFSMPEKDDYVLVISSAAMSFAIGIIQMNYAAKMERKKIKNKNTNTYVRADEVVDSGINIGNVSNTTKLTIDPSGDFSFWSALLAGIKFNSFRQILTIAGNTLNITSSEVSSAIGAVIRTLPGMGQMLIQALPPIDINGIPGFSAVEVLFDVLYQQFRIVRLHLGHILDDKGAPEMSSIDATKPLRAILEVCLKNITSCALKMDEGGNIEVSSTIGNIQTTATTGDITVTAAAGNIQTTATAGNIESTATAGDTKIESTVGTTSINGKASGGVVLGDPLTAAQKAVLGDLLLTWLNNHMHPTAWGPSGPANAGPYGPALPSLLSQKVKLE